IQAITEDAEGNLWFGTRRGAVRFNDRAWRTMPVGPDGLASSYVQALLRDRQGNLWFGTEGGGVSRLAPDRTWHTYTSESTQGGLIHDTVRAIAQDTGHNLWFGTDGGVSVFDGTAWTAHTVKSTSRRGDQVSTATAAAAPASSEVPVDFDNQARADHALASGYAMFGADLTVYEYRGYDQLTGTVALDPPLAQGVTPGTPVYAVERGLVSNSIWAIAVDGQVNVWFGTFEGVSRLAPDGTWKTYTVEDGLIHNRVRALLADREGNLWFGTDGGVSHFDGEWHDYPVPLQHPEDSQLAQNQIQAIFRDQEGNLWFGSRGGVHRLAPEAPPEDQWTTYTTREGLANKDVTAILQDSQGNLWFGTRGGGVSGLREGVFATLAIEDGLAADDVLAIAEDEDGVLWFATDGGGVSRHVPSRVPPQIRLAEILVNNQPRYTEAEGIPAEISLGYKERNGLRIVFGGGDLGTRPEDLQYFYRFREGGAWTPTSDPSVSRSLSPGTYIFCVRARDKDLNDSGPTEPLTIVVNAPKPWEAEWFPWLALTIAMVGPPGGVFAYRWYRRRQPKGYNDLELVIGPAEGAPEGHTVSAVWTAGRRRRRFEEEGKALDQGEVTSLLRKLEREEADEKLLRYLGERLFDALFTADLKEHLIKATGRGKKAVRLRLRFHDNVWLASLPWEYMYGGDNLRFLGTSPETAVTRYLSLEEQAGKLRASLPLKILVVIANPGNLSKLNLPPIEVGAERERLGRTLQPLAPQVELEFLVGASSGGDPISLTEALGLKLQEGYDVIHFSAHGDLEDGQGLLYLEDENGDYLRVYQGELSALFSGLAAQQAPKLIVLNACRTAASPGMGTLSGLAPALVMQGQVPAVVGMQFPISGDAAEIFSSHFYNALARHGQIDYAVSVARKAIAVEVGRDLRDWGIPVLYMQTADGIIFELP
ncbi:MAG: two-component regulator propeller domain-containing protein, partial [Anaerolineae bacterium]